MKLVSILFENRLRRIIQFQFFFVVVEKWVQQTKHPRKRNLLICTDSHLLVHKIRLAQHLIHFSLPSDLQTFLRRFHSSLKFYSSTLSRRLVSDTFNPDYDVPTSIVYFDEQLRNQSLDIFEQLRRSGDYEMPPLLCDTFTVRSLVSI